MKLGHSLTSYIKINSEQLKDLYIRPATEENIGDTFHVINRGIFDDSTVTEKEIKKLDYLKLKVSIQ